MKKLLFVLFLLFSSVAYAADIKITDLTADTAPTSDDLTVTVNSPGGTPATRKATLSNLSKGLVSSNIPNTPVGNIAADDVQEAINELDTEKTSTVGDATGNSVFSGTSGTTLTFNNAGGDAALAYNGTNVNLDKPFTVGLASGTLDRDGSDLVVGGTISTQSKGTISARTVLTVPPVTSGLVLYTSPQSGFVYRSSSSRAVVQWNDGSGSGNDLTQTNAEADSNHAAWAVPYSSSSSTGLNSAVGFNQTVSSPARWLLNIPSSLTLNPQSISVFVVARPQYNAKNMSVFSGASGSAYAYPGINTSMAYNIGSGNAGKMAIWNGNTSSDYETVDVLSNASVQLFGLTSGATYSYAYHNNKSFPITHLGSTTSAGGYISTNNSAQNAFAGYIYEVLIYNRQLATDEVGALQNWAANKYGGFNEEKVRVLCLGDSLTEGYSTSYGNETYPNMLAHNKSLEVMNYGLSGSTASGWNSTYKTTLGTEKFKDGIDNVAVVMIGINDLDQTFGSSGVLSSIRGIGTSLLAAGFKVIFCTILESGSLSAGEETDRDTVNSTLPSYVGTYFDYLIDFTADPVLGTAGISSNTQYYESDTIHLKQPSYEIIARYVQTAINEVLKKQNVLENSAGLAAALSDETGTGLAVFATSPVLTTPNIGSATGSISGNAGTATALAANGSNCSAGSAPLGVNASGAAESCTDFEEDLSNSAGLAAALSDETGTGLSVFGTQPTLLNVDIKNGATSSGQLAIYEDSDNGTNKAIFQVPSLAADTTYTLPPDDGDAGEQLQTNGSGVLTWEAAGSGSPGGSNTYVQFNDSSAFGGQSDFTFTKASSTLIVGDQSTTGVIYSRILGMDTNNKFLFYNDPGANALEAYVNNSVGLSISHSLGFTTYGATSLFNGIFSVQSTSVTSTKPVTAVFRPATSTVASSATPTINTDTTQFFTITAQAAAITSFTTNLSGTPSSGQSLIIRIKDDGTARGITWGASFAARGVTLPTTTVLGKYLYVGFLWNSTASTWDCVASASES